MGKGNNPNIAEAGKAHRWRKGQSGNPSGRPKSKILSDAYEPSSRNPFQTIQKVGRGLN